MTQNSLFDPARMGDLDLPNRVLMAPLTRNRANADGTPGDLAETYYAQRASAGLIVSEATQISPTAKGYLDTPGIHSTAQADGWRKITGAVHAAGGRIFCQLWHVGRISHVSLLPEGRQPEAPSAIRANAKTFTAEGFQDCSEPHAMSSERIKDVIEDYRHAAQMASDAGFDGIEVHGANGYLLDQFLQDGTNKRDDEYGGSVENRMRLLGQVIDSVAEVWPKGRIGLRLSPLGQAGDISDSAPEALFTRVYQDISERNLAYLHVVEGFPGGDDDANSAAMIKRLRGVYSGFYIANGGYEGDSAAEVIGSGQADAVAFGRPFIANPDLPERLRTGAALNEPDGTTFYGGGAEGYTDYPFLSKAEQVA